VADFFYGSACGPRLSAILALCAQPLYYLLIVADQKKTRRELLEAFVAQKPDDAFSRYGLAMECVNTGDTSAAESHFRGLLQRNADYVPAYLMFAQMLVKQSRPEDAREILQRGISAASKAGNGHALSEMEALLNEL
jgi:predicted Zn-dependent protease